MRPHFEWHTDGEHGEGETIARTPQRWFRLPGWVKRAALIVLAGAVLLAAAGYGTMQVWYARLRAVAKTEIGRLIEAESSAPARGTGMKGVSVEEVELWGDVAWVEVVEGEVRRARRGPGFRASRWPVLARTAAVHCERPFAAR